jgi:hypothetical protein
LSRLIVKMNRVYFKKAAAAFLPVKLISIYYNVRFMQTFSLSFPVDATIISMALLPHWTFVLQIQNALF